MSELTNLHDIFFKRIFSDHEAAADFSRYQVPADIASLFDYESFRL